MLITAYYLVTASDRAAACFMELGVVAVRVEVLVNTDKGTSEKALAALDGVLCTAVAATCRAEALRVRAFQKLLLLL